jgi:hypothetical protein
MDLGNTSHVWGTIVLPRLYVQTLELFHGNGINVRGKHPKRSKVMLDCGRHIGSYFSLWGTLDSVLGGVCEYVANITRFVSIFLLQFVISFVEAVNTNSIIRPS